MRESLSRLDSNGSNDVQHQQAVCESISLPPEESRSSAPQAAKAFERQKVLAWLSEHVPEKRLNHILSVEQTAIALATQHHVNVEQAAQAGLMHDLAKCFKPKQLLQCAVSNGLEIDPVFAVNPHLLHAEVGAIVAQAEFGVQDETVLAAIRDHTLGSPGMSALSCVVFLADSLEPGRGDTPQLQELRAVSQQDLHRAVWLTCDYTLKYLIESSALIHPRAVLTRNWAMQTATQMALT